jgi:hypothetical protein
MIAANTKYSINRSLIQFFAARAPCVEAQQNSTQMHEHLGCQSTQSRGFGPLYVTHGPRHKRNVAPIETTRPPPSSLDLMFAGERNILCGAHVDNGENFRGRGAFKRFGQLAYLPQQAEFPPLTCRNAALIWRGGSGGLDDAV